MRRVQVELGSRSYLIHIGSGVLGELGGEARRFALGNRCAIITDRNVGRKYASKVAANLKKNGFDARLITVPPGEGSKSLWALERCFNELAKHRLERKSFIVALGGGVVGDLAGFLAATYLRGVEFIQVPTSLLAQVDSSVGGKVGVNLKAGKNLVGSFHQPRLVLCDLDTLSTLPSREFKAGLAEVIKYGIIYDAGLFTELERSMNTLLARNPNTLGAIVARCCEIKADIVGQDERETGLRAILNFGHTVGHAIEAVFGYGKFLHGEAISIGQIVAAELSHRILGLPVPEVDRIRTIFERAGLPAYITFSPAVRRKLIEATRLDKKVLSGKVRFVLAESIGRVVWGQDVPERMLDEALQAVAKKRSHVRR